MKHDSRNTIQDVDTILELELAKLGRICHFWGSLVVVVVVVVGVVFQEYTLLWTDDGPTLYLVWGIWIVLLLIDLQQASLK